MWVDGKWFHEEFIEVDWDGGNIPPLDSAHLFLSLSADFSLSLSLDWWREQIGDLFIDADTVATDTNKTTYSHGYVSFITLE